ncbi:MAG: PDZ domain-containing protein, partial [Deltaproteobacteria bacterium]|nr:PDZ domain-containing protein [Deltaproteobacteria bacterium]
DDSLEPTFEVTLPQNVYMPPDRPLRIELWDADVSDQIIGVWRGTGLPSNALPDADAGLMLEGGTNLIFRIHPPETHRGIGITEYEVRGNSLRIVSVERFSPAGRAGLEAGDDITAIGGRSIGDYGAAAAASALSMAMDRREPLQVVRHGQPRSVTVDRDLTWLTM